MAATIQVVQQQRPHHRRLPSDPMNESIYALMPRPGDDRPPPLFRSKYASHVRAQHLAQRSSHPGRNAPQTGMASTSGGGGGMAGGGARRVVSDGAAFFPRTVPKTSTGLYATTPSKQKTPQGAARLVQLNPAAAAAAATARRVQARADAKVSTRRKKTSKPISKPTSGRIALAAERRSNAGTPVVADPTRWDNLAADEAEQELLDRYEGMSLQDAGSARLKSSSPLRHAHNYRDPDEEVEEDIEEAMDEAEDNQELRQMSSKAPAGGKRRIVGAGGGSSLVAGGRRMLPEAERLAILAGLRASHAALLEQYNRMSVSADSYSKVTRKSSMEKQLQLLEDDIKKFSHPNILVDV